MTNYPRDVLAPPAAATGPHLGTHRPQRTPLGYRRQAAALRRVEPLAVAPDIDDGDRASVKQRAIAEALMLLLFRAVWSLNLASTVLATVLIGRAANELLLGVGRPPLADIDYALIAVLWQLFVTHIEQYLWRTGTRYTGSWREQWAAFWADLDKSRLAIVVFFGVTDALPTAWLILRGSAYVWDTMPYAIPYLAGAAIGTLMAMTVEPAMHKHRRAMKRHFSALGYSVGWM